MPLPAGQTAGNPRFLQAADRIGYELCREAMWAGDRCNWLGWSTEPIGQSYTPVYRALSPSLYNGVSGVALFLATLWQFTRDRHQHAILRGALQQLSSTSEMLDAPAAFGHFSGRTGVAYAFVRAGEILEEPKLIKTGIRMLKKMRGVALPEASIDVLGGPAGTIPVLLDIAKRHNANALVDIASEHGEHLLRLRQEDAHGVSWPSPMSERNLTGYSHGVAGIALALFELHHVTGDERFLAAARGGIRYERSVYDATVENWPDYRIDPSIPVSGPRYAAAWCNGATGIGYSRLRLLELFPGDTETLLEIDAAMRTTLKALTTAYPQDTADYTLCHGISGNADFLLETAIRFDRSDLRTLVENLGENGLKTYQDVGLPWPCGVPRAGETPALLLGTAGIGYFYLRLYDAARAESILVLRPGRT
jgi:type 2 lantibiotic biosynthesis protein LanM